MLGFFFFFWLSSLFPFCTLHLKKESTQAKERKKTRGKDKSPGQQTAQKKQATS
jgi:hypothetical protein